MWRSNDSPKEKRVRCKVRKRVLLSNKHKENLQLKIVTLMMTMKILPWSLEKQTTWSEESSTRRDLARLTSRRMNQVLLHVLSATSQDTSRKIVQCWRTSPKSPKRRRHSILDGMNKSQATSKMKRIKRQISASPIQAFASWQMKIR